MTLMSSSSKLTTSVDQLAGEANVTKAQLDAKVAQANEAVDATQVEQAATEAARDEAATHAATAATHLATVKAGVTYQGISAILAEKAVTAVDVFVYDTSLDSDGGAWRKRCQHTSWFNEPLNTATRGARREFPAVAVIVAETNRVTIYDGDDPALPMWKVLPDGVYFWDGYAGLDCVAAGQAKIAYGMNFSSGISALGIYVLDFAADTFLVNTQNDGGGKRGLHVPLISGINGPLAISGNLYALASPRVNDLAITVLPDAPIDLATRLPVPTIAVATDGGCSIIKHDGTVANSSATSGVVRVAFAETSLVWCHAQTPHNWMITDKIGEVVSGWAFTELVRREDAIGDDYPRGPQAISPSTRYANLGGNSFAMSNTITPSTGVFLYERGEAVAANKNKGLMAKVGSVFNSGWMLGDIKGAFLSDTDDTDLVGSGELVTNGDFATNDLTGWVDESIGTGSVDVSSGVAVITGTDVSNRGRIAQTFSGLTVGRTYELRFTISIETCYVSGIGNTNYGVGEFTVLFVASTTNPTVRFERAGYLGQTGVDNVSIKLADADRSVNNKGLIVNGTITRSPVADGAELVAYSGFSDSDYLESGPTNGFSIGTGDFCIMTWAKMTGSFGAICAIGNGTSGNKLSFKAGTTGVGVYASTQMAYTPFASGSTRFHHLAVVRRNGVATIYINGQALHSVASAHVVGGDGYTLMIGNEFNIASGDQFFGSLSLLRVSQTAPTADQIAKIYEDERKLFMPGAQCTLFGTSDAVTALAHDPKTNLLHVGTSAGRSTFDGLICVANTETPVTTAISAVGGMIAEQ